MATFRFELTSPERRVFADEVEHVVVPGSEGEFGVLAGHAPLVAMLRPGILSIIGANERRFVVRGGALETLEGTWQPQRLVVLEFDSVERAKAWLASPGYAHARSLRHAAAHTEMIVVEGAPA